MTLARLDVPALLTVGGTGALTVVLSGVATAPVRIDLALVNPHFDAAAFQLVVPVGASSATTQLTGTSEGTTTVQARNGDVQLAHDVTVHRSGVVDLQALDIRPEQLRVGEQAAVVVTLSEPAPVDTSVSLQLVNPKGDLADYVLVVPAGQRRASTVFTATQEGGSTVRATADGGALERDVTVLAAATEAGVTSVFLPATMTVGSGYVANVTIGQPARAGGEVVSIGVEGGVLDAPASVVVPAGSSSTTFTVVATGEGTGTLTASANGASASGSFTVEPV